MLDVLGGESGTVQVRTSNSWMRREDEKKKKNIKGIRRLNLNSSTLLWHTHPPAVSQEQNTLHFILYCLQNTQLAQTLGTEFALVAGSVTKVKRCQVA